MPSHNYDMGHGKGQQRPTEENQIAAPDQTSTAVDHLAHRSSKTDTQQPHISTNLTARPQTQTDPSVQGGQNGADASNTGPDRTPPGRFSNRIDLTASRQTLAMQQRARAQLMALQQARMQQQFSRNQNMMRPQPNSSEHLAMQPAFNFGNVLY